MLSEPLIVMDDYELPFDTESQYPNWFVITISHGRHTLTHIVQFIVHSVHCSLASQLFLLSIFAKLQTPFFLNPHLIHRVEAKIWHCVLGFPYTLYKLSDSKREKYATCNSWSKQTNIM